MSRCRTMAAAYMLLTATIGFTCSPNRPQPEYLTGTWLVYPGYHVVIDLKDDCTYEATKITDAPSPPVVVGEWELTDWGFRWITLSLDDTRHQVLPIDGALCFPISMELIDGLSTCGWIWNRVERALEYLDRTGDSKAELVRSQLGMKEIPEQ